MPAKKSKKGSNEQATSILYHTLTLITRGFFTGPLGSKFKDF